MSSYDFARAHFYLALDKSDFISKDEFNILDSATVCALGHSIELYIVGESHFLLINSLEYQEILAHSEFLKNKSIFSFELQNLKYTRGTNFDLLRENEHARFRAQLSVVDGSCEELGVSPGAVLRREFDNGAISSISVSESENNKIIIDTLHSYPEYEKSILSKTIINLHN